MAILYSYTQSKRPATDYERDMSLHLAGHRIVAELWDDTDGFVTRCVRMIESDRKAKIEAQES